jgi:hypothetical protein
MGRTRSMYLWVADVYTIILEKILQIENLCVRGKNIIKNDIKRDALWSRVQ